MKWGYSSLEMGLNERFLYRTHPRFIENEGKSRVNNSTEAQDWSDFIKSLVIHRIP